MLQLLRLKNFAIVSELEVEFGPGMNVITGETGSGKSLLLKGLELLRGCRASADLIRSGAEKAEVEALFILSPEVRERTLNDLREDFEWVEEIFGEDEVLLRRVIDVNGRGKILINSRLTTRAELEVAAGALFDITGQHSQQRLLEEKFHLRCLDQFGVSKALLSKVRDDYESWAAVKKSYDAAKSNSTQREGELRRTKFEFEELSTAQLKSGEKKALEANLKRASSTEAISIAVTEAISLLDDEEEGAIRTLGRVKAILGKISRLDEGITQLLEIGEAASEQLLLLSSSIERYGSNLELDPKKLELYRERISDLARLERKYGKSTDELVLYLSRLTADLELLQSGAYDIDKLEKELGKLQQSLTQSEADLTTDRKKVAAKFSTLVEKGLSDLEMKKARFNVDVSSGKSTELGADNVKFMLAANPGEPAQALSEVASGGELSRVLLVLKSLLNELTTPVLQVFDEVDVGVGGATSQIMGEQLKDLSRRFQLIVVTHAPQIAALADRHVVLSKSSTDLTTEVVVRELSTEDRVMEVARMLAGREVTKQFIKSAQELIGVTGKSKRL